MKMWFYKEGTLIDEKTQKEMMEQLVEEARQRFNRRIKKVLLLPPDITRYHSGAGKITNMLYHILEPVAILISFQCWGNMSPIPVRKTS